MHSWINNHHCTGFYQNGSRRQSGHAAFSRILRECRKLRKSLIGAHPSFSYSPRASIWPRSPLPGSSLDPAPRQTLTLALALDLAVTLPVSYYWLIARPRRQTLAPTLTLTAICLLRAALLAPIGQPWRPAVAVCAELGIGLAVLARLRSSRPAAMPWIARAFRSELSILYYALPLAGTTTPSPRRSPRHHSPQ